jgi:hypothetical protein
MSYLGAGGAVQQDPSVADVLCILKIASKTALAAATGTFLCQVP